MNTEYNCTPPINEELMQENDDWNGGIPTMRYETVPADELHDDTQIS